MRCLHASKSPLMTWGLDIMEFYFMLIDSNTKNEILQQTFCRNLKVACPVKLHCVPFAEAGGSSNIQNTKKKKFQSHKCIERSFILLFTEPWDHKTLWIERDLEGIQSNAFWLHRNLRITWGVFSNIDFLALAAGAGLSGARHLYSLRSFWCITRLENTNLAQLSDLLFKYGVRYLSYQVVIVF